jgi:hypothetical protein
VEKKIFKKGDRVRIRNMTYGASPTYVGRTGTIDERSNSDLFGEPAYWIYLDDSERGFNGKGIFTVSELELLPETTSSPETIFDVGDRVISTKDGLRGVVTELVNSRNSDFYFVWVRFDGPGFSETRRDSELVFEGEPIKTFTGYRTGDITDTHNEDQRNDSKEPQYYGCVFPNGRTVLSWNTSVESLSVFDSYAEFEKIHGHYEDGYGTFIAWDKK